MVLDFGEIPILLFVCVPFVAIKEVICYKSVIAIFHKPLHFPTSSLILRRPTEPKKGSVVSHLLILWHHIAFQTLKKVDSH